MAAVQCRGSKCTAERKWFRRELDSWRHKVIHCVGFESILEGLYGPLLLRDLNVFDDCEPEEVDDWSVEASCSHCSFCNLPLDKLCDQSTAAVSPLSSPSDYSPCQAPTISENSQLAHRFLQAVFQKKDVPLNCDSNIPLVAEELMRKMIHQFAIEYASKSCLVNNTPSPLSDTANLDAPLDLTVSREKEREPQPDGVLDLSKRNTACPVTSSPANHKASGRQRRQREEYIERSWELSEGLLSKALKDVRSGRLQEQRASLLYGIPLHTLRQGMESWPEGRLGLLRHLTPASGDFSEEVTSYSVMSLTRGGEARLVLQKVAAWAERAEIGGATEENGDIRFPSSSLSSNQQGSLKKTVSFSFPHVRDALQPAPSPTPSLEPPTQLRIPQVRSISDHKSSFAEAYSMAEGLHLHTSSTEGTSNSVRSTAAKSSALFKLRPPFVSDACVSVTNNSPHRPVPRSSSLDDSEEGSVCRYKDKQPRKKRGRYRQYDHDLLEEAIAMVIAGRMSVSKAQSVYGVPHSTLEYKVKERSGTLKNPPKKKNANSSSSGTMTGSTNSGTYTSAAATNSFLCSTRTEDLVDPGRREAQCRRDNKKSTLDAVLCSLCPTHRSLLYQILKLAHQEQLFTSPRPISQADCHCCHRAVIPQDVAPRPFPFSDCKAHTSNSLCPLTDCDQNHPNTPYHSTASKSRCSIQHYSFSSCKSKAQGSSCCCVQSCRVTAYPVFCLKSLHCISCQSLAISRIDNVVCSFASSPPLSSSPALCASSSSSLCPSSSVCPASSMCCSHHSPHPCPCYSNHTCLAQVRLSGDKGDGDGNLNCPVLKREQSPSPPPLSPITSDINGKTEEKPPSLQHHTHEEGHGLSCPLMVKDVHMDVDQQEVNLDSTAEEELECETPRTSQTENNLSRRLLQDVVDRFSEKLETIEPVEKDSSSSTINSIDKDRALTSSADQSLQSHADAHLSEIITTVLHTGTDSDYSLSELLHRHDSSEAKSPNTRYRRRQEVLAAITTFPDLASNRRQTLQIKRELAMLDLSYSRRKMPLAKRAKFKGSGNFASPTSSSPSDTTLVKEEPEKEMMIQEPKVLGQTQEVTKEEVSTKSEIAPDNSFKEDGKNIGKEDCKIGEEPRLEKAVGNAGRVGEDQDKRLALEGEIDEVKEEIQTVIVTEGIETIKVEETERDLATGERQNVATNSQIINAELHRKYNNQGSDEVSLCCSIGCEKDADGSYLGKVRNTQELESTQSPDGDTTLTIEKVYHSPVRQNRESRFLSKSSNFREERRSRRNIVPPQRFSSYVTEPRKMYFVACFSESIFNQKTSSNKVLKSSTIDTFFTNPNEKDPKLESIKEPLTSSCEAIGELAIQLTPKEQFGTPNKESKNHNQVFPVTMATRAVSTRPYGRLRSSRTNLQNLESEATFRTPQNHSKSGVGSFDTYVEKLPSPQDQYNSPIKLMYVSPVMGEKGVKYSLKSATSFSSGQVEEPFDPCEESSWAGTPEKNKSPGIESPTSLVKSVSSPLKFTTLSPNSASLSPKSLSPKSAPSSPKVSARRSGEGGPPKRVIGTENQRSPGHLLPINETTPIKRRPGRPKKLGPQLEKKVKRPIGRPRKQKVLDPISGANADNVKVVLGSDTENANKNLKITVVYGRSRRNKRLVSEGSGQLKTEIHEAWPSMDQNNDLNKSLQSSQISNVKPTSAEWPEDLNLVRPVKHRDSVPHSSSNIKCQKLQGAVPIRKPGRPAKVKISGISVTVTTVSPRQRKIQMNKDARQSLKTPSHKKALLPELKSAKEPWTTSLKTSDGCIQKEGRIKAKDESSYSQPDRPVPVRHSVRVRKPSIYLLHSVATSSSRSYSHSTALLRRSRQLLLNKASNQRKKEEAQGIVETSGETRQLLEQERKHIFQDLSWETAVSVDSIFPSTKALRWWATSAKKKTLSQELARRIRLVSDTWVSDSVDSQEKIALQPKLCSKGNNGSLTKRSRHSSVVRMLFDCPPNNPSSCSMQQLRSWFMQTTETQSLAIVKKASSRNPYEIMHYPCSANKRSVCPSPQAERLRKHIKKFAKTVPKSPLQHQRARERLRERKRALLSTETVKRQLFTPRFALSRLNQIAPWWRGRVLGKYQTTLLRARARFLTHNERRKWPKRQSNNCKELKLRLAASRSSGLVVTTLQSNMTFSRALTDPVFDCSLSSYSTSSADQTQESMDVPKEPRLSSQAWSPEKLKECRVFLKKINSPDSESAAEGEWDSCTVTLDDGSSSAHCLAGRESKPTGAGKAVKTERKKRKRWEKNPASRQTICFALKSSQDERSMGRQKGKWRHAGVVSAEPQQPPLAKMLRQSRVRGLSGPRWCDFILEN